MDKTKDLTIEELLLETKGKLFTGYGSVEDFIKPLLNKYPHTKKVASSDYIIFTFEKPVVFAEGRSLKRVVILNTNWQNDIWAIRMNTDDNASEYRYGSSLREMITQNKVFATELVKSQLS